MPNSTFKLPTPRNELAISVLLGLAFAGALFVLMALAQMLGEVEVPESEIVEIAPPWNPPEIDEIEDFAFETARLLIDQRAGTTMRDSVLALWQEAGIDPADFLAALASERDVIARELGRTGGRFGPISGFVVPTLRSIGLFSDRIAGHFEEMWSSNMGAEAARAMRASIGDVPDDLEAWVNEGYEAL